MTVIMAILTYLDKPVNGNTAGTLTLYSAIVQVAKISLLGLIAYALLD